MMDMSIVSDNAFFREDINRNDVKVKGSDNADTASAHRRVAKEVESLFAYQLLKIMRETVNNISDENKGIGNETYSSLFDMEVSRLLSERGLGLQDSIVKWLDRMPASLENNNNDK